ncbi:hypothetical protein ACQCSX_17460 [Pseudarthrobacter sp. P1]|uniref:hypothetical protein n=1 Tax=Pseudarthrobacter sp. P1 TaxID=3418418 RepID=UPI003CEE929E
MTNTGRPAPTRVQDSAQPPAGPRNPPRGNPRGWAVFAAAATVLAVVSVGSLAALLLLKLAGADTWSGLVWIPMVGLPVAFVMLGSSVLRAIVRRRSV